MASSSSKTLMDLWKQPAAKRLKKVSSIENFISSALSSSSSSSRKECDEDPKDVVSSTPEQKSRMELKRSLAKAKRNLKLCSDKISKLNANGEGGGYVKLQELLIEETWLEALPGEFEKPYAGNLCKFVEKEISGGVPIYPPLHLIFNALNTTAFDRIKAVIIGQDPYHGPGQAMGLSFSVPKGVKVPSSLINIYKELKQDLGCSIPLHGNLEQWAVQGVLLLNAVLTGRYYIAIVTDVLVKINKEILTERISVKKKKRVIIKSIERSDSEPISMYLDVCLNLKASDKFPTVPRHHQANSHANKGWEQFTDAIIKTISKKKEGVVFILWGNYAQAKARLVDETKHHILKSAHPSGLSANRGFFGCRHFSQTNQLLEKMGMPPIEWQL